MAYAMEYDMELQFLAYLEKQYGPKGLEDYAEYGENPDYEIEYYLSYKRYKKLLCDECGCSFLVTMEVDPAWLICPWCEHKDRASEDPYDEGQPPKKAQSVPVVLTGKGGDQ